MLTNRPISKTSIQSLKEKREKEREREREREEKKGIKNKQYRLLSVCPGNDDSRYCRVCAEIKVCIEASRVKPQRGESVPR